LAACARDKTTVIRHFPAAWRKLLANAGCLQESFATAEEMLRRIEQNHQFWCMPEALRVKGDVMLS
jgi:hypothetical protein